MISARPWVYATAYAVALLWPLAFIATSGTGRDLSAARIASDAIGFVALNALALQLVVPSRMRRLTAPFGVLQLLRFHRLVGTAALLLVVVHVGLLFADDAAATSDLFDVPDAGGAPRAALIGLVALLLIDVTSRARVRARFAYERWRLLHIVLAIVAPTASFVHVVLVARFSDDPAIRWGSFVMVAIAVCCVFFLRVARPFAGGWLEYRVRDVRADGPTAWALTLEPDGHVGFTFEPGQFAWLKFADSRYSLSEHPFSMASSARRATEIGFIMRRVGDFTGSAGSVPVGTRVLVDGPHGAWRPVPGTVAIFVVGGVGVTPALSACASVLDGLEQPTQVVLGCRTVDDVVGRRLVDAANAHPLLDTFLVPTEPPPGWTGAHGYLTADMLGQLPGGAPDARSWFVCGPPAMTKQVAGALRELGVPQRLIHVEAY